MGTFPKPASAPGLVRGVSRSGVIPEPTVIVRMRENGFSAGLAGAVRHSGGGAARTDPRNPEEALVAKGPNIEPDLLACQRRHPRRPVHARRRPRLRRLQPADPPYHLWARRSLDRRGG